LSKGGGVKGEDEEEEDAFAIDYRTRVDDGRSKLRCMNFVEKARAIATTYLVDWR
jgi:hypothetical protein